MIFNPPTETPTGLAGVTAFTWGAYTRLFKDGRQVLRLPSAGVYERPGQTPEQTWIVLGRGGEGVIAVDPKDWSSLNLYEGGRMETSFLAQDGEYLVFSLRNDPARGEMDPRYGVSSTEPGVVLNMVSKTTRIIVGKHFLKGLQWLRLADHDPVVAAGGTVSHARRREGDCYWPAAPDRLPVRVTPESLETDYRMVLVDDETALIAWKDTVYESAGGGVILVKDFAAGTGLEQVIKDPRIGLTH